MKKLGRVSIGVGDRFGREGAAQIAAAQAIEAETGIGVDLVWNKSNREHKTIGTVPADQRAAADGAVRSAGWKGAYFVDADHIGQATVGPFLDHCDFYTIDVADYIGKKADAAEVEAFLKRRSSLVGKLELPGLAEALVISEDLLRSAAEKYLLAVSEAAAVYRLILAKKGDGNFVPEVSMDETETPQSPAELLIILAALADAGVPVQTIAPKFSGRFNKGVDYVGSVPGFLKEFREDVAVAIYAAKAFGLPSTLKLSVHSGSDKFAIYPGIGAILKETGAGVHLKTAGTTWLEELVGLAEGGGEGLKLAAEIYRLARSRYDELVGPYASVLDVHPDRLPSVAEVESWSSEQYASALRHVQSNARFNADFRQYLHVSYKVAAELGGRYLDALEAHRESVNRNVRENLLDRHLRPLISALR